MSLGETIRKAREEHRLTQSALAGRVGVTPGFITKLEKDEALPGTELILALAGVLKLPREDLFKLAETARSERSGRRIRTRGAAFRMGLGVPAPKGSAPPESPGKKPLPGSEQLGRMILDDSELQSAFEHLRAALADPELKGAVLKMLETFARQAGRSGSVRESDRGNEGSRRERS